MLLAFLGFVPFASAKDANPVFGYYEAIVYDTEMHNRAGDPARAEVTARLAKLLTARLAAGV